MNAIIRDAGPVDAVSIVDVARGVWPEDLLDVRAIGSLIGEIARSTVVAELDGRIVGFVDGFTTKSRAGSVRWEVDLLAVSPHAQGHGIGRALVRSSIEAGVRAAASSARGLIRIDNIASERVFAACGFAPESGIGELWVAERLVPTTDTDGMHVVPVRTFRYEGLWLEAVNAAGLLGLRSSDQVKVVGALISIDDREAIAVAGDAGLQPGGEFRFWCRELRS